MPVDILWSLRGKPCSSRANFDSDEDRFQPAGILESPSVPAERKKEKEKERKSVPHGEEKKEGRMIAGFKSFALELRLYNAYIALPPSTTNT